MHDYRERLRVPVAWWLLAVPTVVTLGGYFYTALPNPWPPLIIACLAAASAGLLLALGNGRVEVTTTALHAGRHELPLDCVTEVMPLDERQTSRLRGAHGDPAARLYSRPYLRRAVYLATRDPRVPYWLVGTRHPAELATSIEKMRAVK